MADGLNRVLLVGNVGMDPELKYTQGGQAVLRLRVATSESYLDKAGQRQDKTEWHTVIIWGKRAEGLNKILVKGSGVWIEGKLQTRSWESQQGEKRSATEVNASNIGLVGSRPGGAREQGEPREARGGGGDRRPQPQHRDQLTDYDSGGAGGDYDDDIPF